MPPGLVSNIIAYLITLFCLRVAMGREQFEHWQLLLVIAAGVGVLVGGALARWIF